MIWILHTARFWSREHGVHRYRSLTCDGVEYAANMSTTMGAENVVRLDEVGNRVGRVHARLNCRFE